MDSDIDRRIAYLAAEQQGVVAKRQLAALGIRSDAVRRRVRSGRLVEISGRVLRVAGAPETELSRVFAAVLDAGARAVSSHDTAAARWGLPGFRMEPVQVIASRGRMAAGSQLAVLHEPRRLRRAHVVELDGVAITTPTRTIFDLANTADVSPARLERTLDTALARNLVSHRSLHRVLDDVAGRGRRGSTLMRSLLDARPADFVPPESGTEARFQELARRAGLRHLERQVDVGGDDGWIGRVDFIDRRRRLVIEVGDALFHGSLTDQRHDDRRRDGLEAAGMTVITIEAVDVFHRSDELVARLRSIANLTNPRVPAVETTGQRSGEQPVPGG